jgi:hypothetical protein
MDDVARVGLLAGLLTKGGGVLSFVGGATFTTTALLRAPALIGESVTGGTLGGVDLPGVDLLGADLTGADLTGADFTGADLPVSDLTGSDLAPTDLVGTTIGAKTFVLATPSILFFLAGTAVFFVGDAALGAADFDNNWVADLAMGLPGFLD